MDLFLFNTLHVLWWCVDAPRHFKREESRSQKHSGTKILKKKKKLLVKFGRTYDKKSSQITPNFHLRA